MSLDHAIMGFLSSEELTGYDLKTRCFDQMADHFWPADQAQIYRTLDRLQRRGLVSAKHQVQRGKPNRNVYKLTKDGRESLDGWLAGYHPSPPNRDPFLIQVAFADHLSESETLELLASARDERQARLESLRASAAGLATDATAHSERSVLLRRLTYDAAVAKETAAIDWLDDCVDSLRGVAVRSESTKRSSRKKPLR